MVRNAKKTPPSSFGSIFFWPRILPLIQKINKNKGEFGFNPDKQTLFGRYLADLEQKACGGEAFPGANLFIYLFLKNVCPQSTFCPDNEACSSSRKIDNSAEAKQLRPSDVNVVNYSSDEFHGDQKRVVPEKATAERCDHRTPAVPLGFSPRISHLMPVMLLS